MKKVSFLLLVALLRFSASGQELQGPLRSWVRALSADSAAMARLYLSGRHILFSDQAGSLSFFRTDPQKLYSEKLDAPVDSIWSLAKVDASPEVDYELVKMRTSGADYGQVIVWRRENGRALRELEILARYGDQPTGLIGEIDKARQQWVKLCNSHVPADLVSQMYTPNAIYYNHRPLIVGTEAIAATYSYMSRPQYELNLTPITVEVVSEDTVFEIGQCSGSYGGRYVLVWVKNADGRWQVAFDSNI